MALQDLQERARSAKIMMGADDRVFTKQYKSGNKLRWLKEYDAQREQGVGTKTAMRASYEVVRKQVKDAARERGARRGVKSMFERQRRQQEAQALGQAVEAGVPGDDEEGGSQGSSQGRRLGSHSGVHRSLQEVCDMEEETHGDREVPDDMGAGTPMGKQTCLHLGSIGEGDAAGGVGGDTGVRSDSPSEGGLAGRGDGRGDGDRGHTK